jgi:hypothetical protein
MINEYVINYFILSMGIISVILFLIGLSGSLNNYLKKHQMYGIINISRMFLYYIFALFIVALSATIGPYTIEHFGYTINCSYEMTASEATYYTLQAFIAVVIGSLFSNSKQ